MDSMIGSNISQHHAEMTFWQLVITWFHILSIVWWIAIGCTSKPQDHTLTLIHRLGVKKKEKLHPTTARLTWPLVNSDPKHPFYFFGSSQLHSVSCAGFSLICVDLCFFSLCVRQWRLHRAQQIPMPYPKGQTVGTFSFVSVTAMVFPFENESWFYIYIRFSNWVL